MEHTTNRPLSQERETTQPQAAEPEMVFHCYRDDCWNLYGTRAQLEAEGVLPAKVEWPAGAKRHIWEAGDLNFILCRSRPAGMKGPKSVWINGDWWFLGCYKNDAPGYAEKIILEKQRELERVRYEQSPEGKRLWSERYWKCRKAADDSAYQTFRDKLIPRRKKPGRKVKGEAA